MKVVELFEAPANLGDLPSPVWKGDPHTLSDSRLEREFDFLGKLERSENLGDARFWLRKEKTQAIVTLQGENDIGEMRNRSVVILSFHDQKSDVPVKNELQVDTVKAETSEEARGLTSALYIVLCRYGFSIVSDFEQYIGGKKLWQKIARESDARKCVVRIWDDSNQKWLNDKEGHPLKYNAANIAEDHIWNEIHIAASEGTCLLVLQSE